MLAARIAARHKVPERYSLSHDNENYANFSYFVILDEKDEKFSFLNMAPPVNGKYEGLAWFGDSRSGLPAGLSIESLREPKISVERVYKAVSVRYKSPISFILGEAPSATYLEKSA